MRLTVKVQLPGPAWKLIKTRTPARGAKHAAGCRPTPLGGLLITKGSARHRREADAVFQGNKESKDTQIAMESRAEDSAVSTSSSAKYMRFPLSSGFLSEVLALKMVCLQPSS